MYWVLDLSSRGMYSMVFTRTIPKLSLGLRISEKQRIGTFLRVLRQQLTELSMPLLTFQQFPKIVSQVNNVSTPPHKTIEKIIWINLREEPVCYINGSPHVWKYWKFAAFINQSLVTTPSWIPNTKFQRVQVIFIFVSAILLTLFLPVESRLSILTRWSGGWNKIFWPRQKRMAIGCTRTKRMI